MQLKAQKEITRDSYSNFSRSVDFTYIQSRTFNGYSALVGTSVGAYNYPSALAFGDEISDNSSFLEDPLSPGSSNGGTLNFDDGASGDQWTSANTNYEIDISVSKFMLAQTLITAGLKWQSLADAHFSVESVALNLTPAESLTAGEGEDQLSVLDANYKNIKVTTLDNQINISAHKNINYNLYS